MDAGGWNSVGWRDRENFVVVQGFLLCDARRAVGHGSGREFVQLVCINTRMGEKGTRWEGRKFETKFSVYCGGECGKVASKLLKGDEVLVVGELTSSGGKQSAGRNGRAFPSLLAVSARVLTVTRRKVVEPGGVRRFDAEATQKVAIREYQDVGEEVDS